MSSTSNRTWSEYLHENIPYTPKNGSSRNSQTGCRLFQIQHQKYRHKIHPISGKNTELNIYNYTSIQIEFYCFTCCQKPAFNDKKKSMILHTILTDEEGSETVIKTGLNVQLNPGRGAKAVVPKAKTRNGYKVSTIFSATGENRNPIIKIALSLPVNPQMAHRSEIDLGEYSENMAIELNNHMNNIHRRDTMNFNDWSKKHREILSPNKSGTNRSSNEFDPNNLINANPADINQNVNQKFMSLKIAIPQELEFEMNQTDMKAVWNNIQNELQQLAVIKLQYWLNTRPRCSINLNGDAIHLAAALDEAHRCNIALQNDNIAMANMLNNYQNTFNATQNK